MKFSIGKAAMMILLLVFALLCVFPFYLTLIGSMTNEHEIRTLGYSLWPQTLDFTAYYVLFRNSEKIIRGGLISVSVLLIGTPLCVLVNAMLAYPISQKRVKYRNALAFISFFTMLFNGGMIPWYIVCVNLLRLKDSLFALILPYLANAVYVMFFVNYFRSVPAEMSESAMIDGARDLRTFFQIMLPVSVPVIATVALFAGLEYWNDWWLGIMLIDKTELQPLQILLRTIVSNIQFLNSISSSGSTVASNLKAALPSESIKMATCIVTIGPIIFLYPFMQRYFIKGIMIGAVKG